jgi:23S rRNA (uracil1939-C5)-methyltransferase
MPEPRPGHTVTLDIDNLAFGGQGIGRLDGGLVVFVPGAVPGDRIEARITRKRRRYAEAALVRVIENSVDRTDPTCPAFGICGGCAWQNLDYRVQLSYKQQQVAESLERLGGLKDFALLPIVPADRLFHYRNKVEFSVGLDESGMPAVGFHPRGRWDVVLPVSDCLLAAAAANTVRAVVHDHLVDSSLTAWDARARSGLLRQVMVRTGHHTGEVLVTLALTEPEPHAVAELVKQLGAEVPGLVGVALAVIPAERAAAPPGEHHLLTGRDFIYETLGSLRLKISAGAFFQTNTTMAHILYDTALRQAALSGTETVWDLYSGIGSIALYLAGSARRVLGVEVVETAVDDARENARANRVENVEFLTGNARVVLKELLEGRTAAKIGPPDVVVVDPPRGGLANKVVARTALAAPGRVVYVSCNPTTLAPNLALFAESSYTPVSVTPVDMFPHTPHIEAVAVLQRRPA